MCFLVHRIQENSNLRIIRPAGISAERHPCVRREVAVQGEYTRLKAYKICCSIVWASLTYRITIVIATRYYHQGRVNGNNKVPMESEDIWRPSPGFPRFPGILHGHSPGTVNFTERSLKGLFLFRIMGYSTGMTTLFIGACFLLEWNKTKRNSLTELPSDER